MGNDAVLGSTLYLLAAVALMVALSKRMGLGSILGLLVAGVVIGPYSPGPVWTDEVETVRHITEFGVVLLLFVIGLEMQPKKLWSMRKEVFGLGSAQILVSGAFIFLYSLGYAITWQAALLIGLTFALSSTAFVMQILQEKGEFYTPTGRSGFAILLMQDLAVVPLLALVPLLSTQGELTTGHPLWLQLLITVGMILFVLILGRYVFPRVLEYLAREQNRDAFFFSIMLAVVMAAWAMEHAGLSMALGAFLMGMLLSSSRYHYQIQAHVEPYKGLLMSLFFVAVGMSVDLEALLVDPLTLLQHLLVIMGIKILVLFGLMLLMGYKRSTAVSVSFLLAQSGEFGFVLFGSAKALGVIGDEMFVAAITIISFSMLLTPMVVQTGEKLSKWLERKTQPEEQSFITLDEAWNGIVIAGYGRVGHLIATMLEYAHVPYVAFDVDPNRVAMGQQEERPVYYGELSDYGFLAKIGLDRAEMVVVTVDSHHSTAKIVSRIRNQFPALQILARTRDMRTRSVILQHGATWAMPEAAEGSLRLGAEALLNLGRPQEEVQELLNYFRKDDYETIRVLHGDLKKS